MKTQTLQFRIITGISWATRLHRAGPTPLEYQSVNARFRHPEIQEVNCDGPYCPIILTEAIKRKFDTPFQTRLRARDKEDHLAHVNGSNAPNEPVLARKSTPNKVFHKFECAHASETCLIYMPRA